MQWQIILTAFIIALIFSAVHLIAPRLYGFSRRYRNAVVSFSGGVAIAYVFLELLPRVQRAGEHLNIILSGYPGLTAFSDVAIFGVAFAGFLVFFISEHAAIHSHRKISARTGQPMGSIPASRSVFAIHLSVLALLSLLIAYSLRFEVEIGLLEAVLFSIALILHFFVADRTMEIHYRIMFERYGRYILSAMPMIGWALSILFPERQSEAAILLAFVAGSVLFNIIKDEVPGAEKSEPKFFVSGALIYSGILLLLIWMRL